MRTTLAIAAFAVLASTGCAVRGRYGYSPVYYGSQQPAVVYQQPAYQQQVVVQQAPVYYQQPAYQQPVVLQAPPPVYYQQPTGYYTRPAYYGGVRIYVAP